MSAFRTERVREILDLAMERPSAERSAFVSGAAGPDLALRAEVLSLLSALQGAGDALEPPAAADQETIPAEPLTGLTFGSYVIGERIGEGGMGVVYTSTDTRLGRTVAVKALPHSLARDPHRRARFEQEARLLATLNHPNIASIYGVEDTPRGPVMILEFVPGLTIAEEIRTNHLSAADSLAIARQIAKGLEAAHAAGIVHRDLKPANIKRTPDGVVKILDLGIAKTLAGREQPGIDGGVATGAGVIVGTASYMSPEQARGRMVDRRADMWAFGCVLFEMLTGKRAFDGETASDAAAAVLRGEPDWSMLPSDTPASVRRLLKRTIERDPERRLRDAGDAILELDVEGEDLPTHAPKPRLWLFAAAIVIAAGLTALAVRSWNSGSAPTSPHLRYTISTPPLVTQMTGGCAAISPDGTKLVFAARDGKVSRLYLRDLSTFESTEIPGTEGGFSPFFSPDGRSIGFGQSVLGRTSWLVTIPIEGGPAKTLAKELFIGASWGDDDTIVYGIVPGILQTVPAAGGTPAWLAPVIDGTSEVHSQPEVLPGSKYALFTRWHRDGAEWHPRIEAIETLTGKRSVILEDASQPRYVQSLKTLVFHRKGYLLAVAMDAGQLVVTGEPRHVTGPLSEVTAGGLSQFSVSNNGTMAIVPGNIDQTHTDLAWFEPSGSTTSVFQGEAPIRTLRLSPDEKRVAYTTDYPETDLWVLDLSRGTPIRLVSEQDSFFPVWTPDGSKIAFQRNDKMGKARIEWIAADGGGEAELLYTHPGGVFCFPTGFSPDGRIMLITAATGNGDDSDVFLVNLNGDRTAIPLLPTRQDRVAARFSPDGTMIAYSSTETGRPEIYVVPYPALDRKVLVSVSGGERPTWAADSKRLFFRGGSTIYAATITSAPALAAGIPVMLLDKLPGDRYDAAGDGTRFIMFRPRGDFGPQTKIEIIVGGLSVAGSQHPPENAATKSR